ncbi:MAG: TetR/AcrR family transcriptional regulator [Clostridiales bacterium]|nr:TetR/AcrR family transcriptional regulator [Clostridiales bacterium]
MTHEEISLQTRQKMANALKNLMRKKALSSITVSEIVTECHLNRKTFYYHFRDIYDLLAWMLDQEATGITKNYDTMAQYREFLPIIMDYIEQNDYLIACAYDSMGRDGMKQFFSRDFVTVIQNFVDTAEAELALNVDAGYKAFLSDLYAELFANMIIDYIQTTDDAKRERMITYLTRFLDVSVPALLRDAATNNFL